MARDHQLRAAPRNIKQACTRAAPRQASAVAELARHKPLHVAQKYARRADQLRGAPFRNTALQIRTTRLFHCGGTGRVRTR